MLDGNIFLRASVNSHLTTQAFKAPCRSCAGSPGDRSAHPKIARPTPSSPRKRPRAKPLGLCFHWCASKAPAKQTSLQPNAWRVRGTSKPKPEPVLCSSSCAVTSPMPPRVCQGRGRVICIPIPTPKYIYLHSKRGLLICPAALTFFVCWVL